MKRYLVLLCAGHLLLYFFTTFVQATEARKLGANDISLGPSTQTWPSPGGKVVTSFPYPFAGYGSAAIDNSAIIDVRAYGADPTGVADSQSAISAAINAASRGGIVFFSSGTYLVASQITVSDNVTLVGVGSRASRIQKGFSGSMMALGDGSGLSNIWIDGKGEKYTGDVISITGTNGRQKVRDTRITDCGDYCVKFEILAGSQSVWDGVEIYQVDGMADGDHHAIFIPNMLNAAGTPRHFNHIETSGAKFIDLGGCNGVFITNSYVGEIKFRSESRGVEISGSRIGVNQTSMMEVYGYNHALSGNNIGPSLTVMPGAQAISIIGNTYNGSVYDNSTTSSWTNHIEIGYREYVPTISTNGNKPTVGNAVVRGVYSRMANTVTLCIDFTMGSSTNLGSGDVTFSIPAEIAPSNNYQQVQVGYGYARQDRTSTPRVSVSLVNYSDKTISFYFDNNTTGGMRATNPFTWATGDNIRGCVSYTR